MTFNFFRTEIEMKFEFKVQDMWVGIFWDVVAHDWTEIWICFLPMFPLHITIIRYQYRLPGQY